ncbi:MAG: elongation factor Ts [Candidatus Magasanikbacteria bacterium CG10_big_fil_rev_8_21_14_0_10_36_32]|uniref:Elongation factor Ts n=1 Tax=Candidatus Magasanikbacteria bacterium CG10_big_fil_rev_8_21_14_0_10_36_32 TaxID=1974646 RepID=A0A2M6W6A6_9BACT|nr:MAG: elongation factor Ts [Candidatus Magasanikbacteria bacterium CG10_big_fil_rev_8_21_14_0_10_36_32]
MAITIQDISKLREMTGAGMMDCKKALDEANGDTDKATEILRKKGVIKAAKRGDKIAAEGLTVVKVQNDVAVIAEVNSESDFAAKSDDFKNLVSFVADYLIENKPASVEEAMKGLQDKFSETVSKIGEKLNLRRIAVINKSAEENFGAYVHMGGKISVLVVLEGGSEDLAREIAMHAAATGPRYLNREEVDGSVLEKEQEIASEQLRAQGKPENIIVNIVKGKMDKFYSEVCLFEQPFIKDEEKTIGQLAETAGAKVKLFWRYELGDGITKKSCDFATEVAEQMK